MSHAQQDWIEALAAFKAGRRPCTLVTVSGVRGSAPRDVGARMIVAEGRVAWGTVGGGNLEHLAVERAAALLGRGAARSESASFPLAEKAGQCCGGEVTLLFEAFPWRRATVAIFGAGHVGQALAGLAPYLAARVLLVDGREEAELVPTPPSERPYELVLVDAPEAELDALPDDAAVVVMTHSHALDLELVARGLRRASLAYLGLIGSERKWARFRARLSQRGATEEELARVTCPIGFGRTSKEPAAIALAVAAQLAEVLARVAEGGARTD